MSGTVDVSARVLDVDMQGVRVQIDGQTLCIDDEAPYSCSWDTTTVANGTHTLTATGVDYQDGQTTAEIDVEVAN